MVRGQDVLEKFKSSLVNLDLDGTVEATKKALKLGVSPYDVMGSMREASDVIGKKWESSEYFISELIAAGSIMKAVTDVLRPHVIAEEAKYKGKVVIGSAPGDLHDIGKNLVAVSLIGAGFEVVDLGVDVPSEKFVEAVRRERPDIVGISALISTTMLGSARVIEALKEAGLRDKVKVIVGGAPLTDAYAESIGADASANDVIKGIKICEEWVARRAA